MRKILIAFALLIGGVALVLLFFRSDTASYLAMARQPCFIPNAVTTFCSQSEDKEYVYLTIHGKNGNLEIKVFTRTKKPKDKIIRGV